MTHKQGVTAADGGSHCRWHADCTNYSAFDDVWQPCYTASNPSPVHFTSLALQSTEHYNLLSGSYM